MTMTYRTGIGIDIHPLVPNRKLILGGIDIPFELGLQGNSDGDVLAHAIIDAMFGAAGLGDIGSHFPANDQKYKGASSMDLLATTAAKLSEAGWKTSYVDATILAQEPILGPHIQNGILYFKIIWHTYFVYKCESNNNRQTRIYRRRSRNWRIGDRYNRKSKLIQQSINKR